MNDRPISEPTNIIYTGVAGTGKTYRLLQTAKQYTHYLPITDGNELLLQLLFELSWRDVVCLIFLDFKVQKKELVKVPEIVNHEFFIAKAAQNAREKNLSNTAWSVLQMHSSASSKTVTYKNRASQAYFDKDESGAWHLLPESMMLLTQLSQQLDEFRQAQQDNQPVQKQYYSMVSFHQAYGYEEFVEGIRPVMGGDESRGQGTQINRQAGEQGISNQMRYDIQDGAFLKLCKRAANDPEHRYAMLIDEINRANVSRVFGELLSLIEPDKRSGQPNAMQVNLAYSGRAFSVPANVDIYATMNTQDHSLAPLDMALRRRFRFIDCPPQPKLLPIIRVLDHTDAHQSSNKHKSSQEVDLAKLLTGLNQRIMQTLGQEAQLGHAFLYSVKSLTQLQTVLVEQIIPQLAQAVGGQVALLQYLFNDEQQAVTSQFIHDSQRSLSQSLSKDHQHPMFADQSAFGGSMMASTSYTINPELVRQTGEFVKPYVYQRLY
ncbi:MULTISPECIES: McrB family protein [unclassified Psychrobacter]|uniref:McrB family protein n=1 Tax=unclassified Psychrobacter TaxID=196806 RepID=UPI003F48D1A0